MVCMAIIMDPRRPFAEIAIVIVASERVSLEYKTEVRITISV